jgi:hypothetical protein
MDAVAPGGCLAVNWADFARHPHLRVYADEVSRLRGNPVFLAPPSLADNLVQLMPARDLAVADVRGLAADFFRDVGADATVLRDCLVTREYPRVELVV